MSLNWSNTIPLELSDRGDFGQSVFVQDQTTNILDLPFLEEIASSAVLDADTVVGTYTIEAQAGHGISAGSVIELANGNQIFYQGRVLAAGATTITLDAPINHIYTAPRTIFESTDQMKVIASTASPRVFSILPFPGQAGDIVRVIIAITSTADQDFETFGADPALTNGLTLRYKQGDEYANIFTWKTNGDFQRRAFDATYQTNKGGSIRAFTARRTFGGQSKNGVVVRLEGVRAEELQVVIADDLVTGSLNQSIKMYAQGHLIQT